MKRIKKLASFALAMIMVLAMAIPAMAAGTGSITINGSAGNGQEGTAVSVAGKTFVAYQVLTAELVNGENADDGIVYRVPDGLKEFYLEYFSLPSTSTGITAASFDQDVTEAIASLAAKAEDLEAFAKAVLDAAKKAIAAGEVINTGRMEAGANDTSVQITGLPLGYYVIEDEGLATPISALALDTTATSATVNVKASQPVIDKKIDGDTDTDDGTEGLVENNNAAIGDVVPYVVTSNVPDMTGYEKYYFVVNDTLSEGLTFNKDVQIAISGAALEDDVDSMEVRYIVLEDAAYDVTVTEMPDGRTGVEIVFKNFIQYRPYVGGEIIISYSATVNEDAVIGVEGNPNAVKLIYSNNPNIDDDGDPDKPDENSPVGETPEKVTRTFVTGIELTKVDPNGNTLTGAEFQITGTKLNTVLVTGDEFVVDPDGDYWALKDGTYTTTAPADDTLDYYQDANTKYSRKTTTVSKTDEEEVAAIGSVGEDGTLRFEGLAAGEYTITELKAPNGYNLLKQPIVVTITFEAPDDATGPCTWKASITDDADNATLVSDATVNTAGIITFEVQNMTGSLLPSTGGIGTTIFYVVGGILVVAAGILLVTKKRMSAR